MAFYGRDFIFGGTMSQELGLTISSESSEASTNAGSDVEPIIQKIYRRPKNYLLGVEQGPVLTFPISFNSETKINATFAAKIEQLLFGKLTYQKLQVIQPDTSMYYWNCFLKNPQIKRVGNEIVGWNCDVTCDSPWAYSFPRSASYTMTPPSPRTVIFNNKSGNNDYSFPTVAFTMNGSGGTFSIVNTTDDSRRFYFTGLSANESISVDNSLQIITSSTGQRRLDKFIYKKFFRVLPGANQLMISGNASLVNIYYVDAQKIGG